MSAAATVPARLSKQSVNKLPPLQLALLFIFGVASFALLPRPQANPHMQMSILGVAGVLFLLWIVLRTSVARSGRVLSYDISLNKAHYIQAVMQFLIYVYWGMYWPNVFPFLPFVAVQIVFVYALDMLITWLRQDKWVMGFGPFPIILSTNLFIWFKDDWFFLQFALITSGVLGKQFFRWHRDGKLTHIFNPSAFSAFVISVSLLATHASSLTWGEEIATTISRPPHIYLEIFLLGVIVQALFSVTLVTVAAATTLVALNLAYTHFTGVYHTIDSGIPAAVFIGVHLLVTDPATSPRKAVGKLIFGSLYGVGVFGMYSALRWFGQPTFYDKLLCVPILNLMVPSLDRFSDWIAARVRLLNTDWAFNPQRYNLAHMAIWATIFSSMLFSGFLAKGQSHPGGSLAFWEQACQEGRWNSCKTWVHALGVTCQFNIGSACLKSGTVLNEGAVVPRDAASAATNLSRACDLGEPEACDRLVALVRSDGQEALQKACDGGNPYSCFTLGAIRSSGVGLARDPARAFALFEKACDKDLPRGCSRVGQGYMYGDGTAVDHVKAIASFEKACRNREAASCAEVASMYSQGLGAPKDEARAARRMQQACNLGLRRACQPGTAAIISTPTPAP